MNVNTVSNVINGFVLHLLIIKEASIKKEDRITSFTNLFSRKLPGIKIIPTTDTGMYNTWYHGIRMMVPKLPR
jgi:hypothetical protein